MRLIAYAVSGSSFVIAMVSVVLAVRAAGRHVLTD